MSTFSLSTVKKVVDPVKVELCMKWEELCEELEAAIAGMPEDKEGEAQAQADWVAEWQSLMVSREPLHWFKEAWYQFGLRWGQ